jgi:hypothetical protein
MLSAWPEVPLMSTRLSLSFSALFALALVPTACSPDNNGDPPAPECTVDADCTSGGFCESGSCIECRESGDCGEGEACCRASCVSMDDPESMCGCGTAGGATAGAQCDPLELCVASGSRVDADTLSQGQCECTCDPASGGTLCTADEMAAIGFSCTCDRTDLSTCERPAVDTGGQLHVVADTCSPQESCVCFGDNAVCDPNGATPDCTIDGCSNLYTNDRNCGVPGRDCAVTGTGQCRNGGCSCNGPDDCTGAGLNVDQCVFLSGGAQCVCDDYTLVDEKAACPLGLNCVDGGCLYDGMAYATAASLYVALGIDAPPIAAPDPGPAPDGGPGGDAGGSVDAGLDGGVADGG